MENVGKIIIVWGRKRIEIPDVNLDDTVRGLKERIYKETNILPERQKLLNLRTKDKACQDEEILRNLGMKPGFKLMLMGSREEDIAKVCHAPKDLPDVINDFKTEEEEIEIENVKLCLFQIQCRIGLYRFVELNPFREGKKLLVLDIDYTIFDPKSTAESGVELMRPFLHQFLTLAYLNYDIVIWSATSMKWINEKMKVLGVSSNPYYKIACHLDSNAMINVHTSKYGTITAKPLAIIWGKYKQFSAKNTIMFDDIRRNFIMNPQSGLKIKPFRHAHITRRKDRELLKLSQYLKLIAKVDDFQTLNHRKWQEYIIDKTKEEKKTKEGNEGRTE
ncbi:ubiquitin-like domain-containing CTD phosphatase 1 [Bombus vosnesenskii]|uniref:Ubiquitin-like domain-containing CTD phosphatase 1 n=3 Tax=Pyrobombus TaxID=144703 RepID=A0A6J3L8G4_9HYME|nr:ubiquitin-like domain-containing CTD phosphatase 1 isoform X1 [Bombus impatiens]XP_033203588.1 ubiquitin-like domain-containing CTD phosphatase 1 isoform X1 [Bombus vancouverensis nearcticus]XP_033304741.1 ubiquitin-like domain-containing CTD phosphatase 1 [Bombus bifarius]XP_033361918.1 ubiquitin-like domain-containing CTD phosphatase 1 [Bombus vosnesenskii]XP_050483749.1 ubiquitin-like domain-containing CTD phosphatase 1 [Bombus huntii]XP_060825086.1 ubiquitin-like domain-containing CTD p